jgi:hypothetical protein
VHPQKLLNNPPLIVVTTESIAIKALTALARIDQT